MFSSATRWRAHADRVVQGMLAVLWLAACQTGVAVDSGRTADTDAGVDSGPDPCRVSGEACGTDTLCCGQLVCDGGSCQEAVPPPCASQGSSCQSTSDCCGAELPTDAGGVICRDAGASAVCADDGIFAPCEGVADCAAGFACDLGVCAPPDPIRSCSPSDLDCTCEFCNSVGLSCLPTGGSANACFAPVVLPPNQFADNLDGEVYLNDGCGLTAACAPLAGESFAPFCADFLGTGECVEGCRSSADCASPTWSCVDGGCFPTLCFVDQSTPAALPLIDAGVPDDSRVLFEPCQTVARAVCLPSYSSSLNATMAECVRYGPPSGATGASCDPTWNGQDPGGQCDSTDLCLLGTCGPWCDDGLALPGVSGCDAGASCIPVNGDLPSNLGATFITGVCAFACDPYLDAGNNPCPRNNGSGPSLLCKPLQTTSDISDELDVIGACVGGRTAPVALGAACDPGLWSDPCASGAFCAGDDGGYSCRQFCDPMPTPGLPVPPCPAGMTCESLQSCSGFVGGTPCQHVGICG